ncbi:MAG: transglycosylase SLT domain-containing protein [Paracoccaceae bacterium]
MLRCGAGLVWLALVLALVPAPTAWAADTWPFQPLPTARPASIAEQVTKAPDGYSTTQICTLIAAAASERGMPPEFFARLIWKESRFDVKAVSPVGAQGIAQFMPATARIRGLKDPWDPKQAIPASAHFLADLHAAFGNWGLAAAGYNCGPDCVSRWLAGKRRSVPYETQNYVQSITFRPVEWFRDRSNKVEPRPLEKGKTFMEGCARLPIIATRTMGTAQARSPWGVQIAAGITRRAARKAYNRARSRLRQVIGGRGPIIVRSKKVAGRTLYSARVGASSRGAARALCGRIRSAGGNCVVRRN